MILHRPTTAAGMVAPVALCDGTYYDVARPGVGYSPPVDVLAFALARIVRWRGQTLRPVSVARHSLVVAATVLAAGGARRLVLAGLLHDAAEAIVGDVPSPTKRLLHGAWEQVERPIQVAIATDYGIAIEDLEDPLVRDADHLALVREAEGLLPIDVAVLGPVAPSVARLSDAAIDAAAAQLGVPPSITARELEHPPTVGQLWARAVELTRLNLTTETTR